ncbi:hypothetical protein B0T11DRAFT_288852 [Plectosphaerella cucumerina]|uniref:Uncharacterized protein n=1 Tax=Plectosphaerella cucumerina TaxID=40658 RepID=A0A8K0T783_9PEZI|nr:hypothetical protein B0T11DRAFT_288852 [Plectosphaerella cucumerina]
MSPSTSPVRLPIHTTGRHFRPSIQKHEMSSAVQVFPCPIMPNIKPSGAALTSLALSSSSSSTAPEYNAALRHPVFFADGMRKPPAVLSAAAGYSPVAHGYVFREAARVGQGSVPKL